MELELIDVIRVDTFEQKITSVTDFDYVKIVYQNANTSFSTAYQRLKPIYIIPLINLGSQLTFFNEAIKVDRNPSIIKMPDLPGPIAGLDMYGSFPSDIYFYKAEEMNNISGISPRTATLRIEGVTNTGWKAVNFNDIPFDFFKINYFLADLESFGDNDSVVVNVYYQENPVARMTITEPSSRIEGFVLSKDYSINVRASSNPVDAISLAIEEAADHQLIVIP